jgi:molecular chaperone GrpE
LPGLDNLILAEKHTQDEGVKLSIKHFLDILENEGVKRIETVGKTFDPNLMEAITTQEGEEGKVLEEVRSGYMLYDSVLRPAQVIVGQKPSKVTKIATGISEDN